MPFLGVFQLLSQCKEACEAIPNCTAFVHAGWTPHIDPQKKSWATRCYGRADHQFPLMG